MPHLRVAEIIEKELSERTPCDVPGCGGEQKRNYMTVNLSLIVGHIRNLEGAFSHGGDCWCWRKVGERGCDVIMRGGAECSAI